MRNSAGQEATLSAQPDAFGDVAASYDADFSATKLGRTLRARVWAELVNEFRSTERVLEVACGTGEDAVWLASRGIRVTASDASAEMLGLVEAKAKAAAQAKRIETLQLSLQDLAAGRWPGGAAGSPIYDGLFSNFGGLNTVSNWRELASALAGLVRPGGKAVLVPMGPICPWEIAWHFAHGKPRKATRRFGRHATARVGPNTIPVWYPSAGRLRSDLSPWFGHERTRSLGWWLPPSYLGHLVSGRRRLFSWLALLDRLSASLLRGWGDHYLMVLRRTSEPAPGRREER